MEKKAFIQSNSTSKTTAFGLPMVTYAKRQHFDVSGLKINWIYIYIYTHIHPEPEPGPVRFDEGRGGDGAHACVLNQA